MATINSNSVDRSDDPLRPEKEDNRQFGVSFNPSENNPELDAVLLALVDPVIISDSNNIIRKSNRAMVESYGFDLAGLDVDDAARRIRLRRLNGKLIPPDELAPARVLGGKPVVAERVLFTDFFSRDVAAEMSAVPVYERGNVTGVVTFFHDVSERESAIRDIRESRRQVLDILDSISDAFFALDNLWRFTYINKKAEEILERRKEDLLFKDARVSFPEVVGSVHYDKYRTAKEEMKPATFDEYYEPLGKWFEVRVFPYNGGLSIYFTDISKGKFAERDRGDLLARLSLERDLLDAVLLNMDEAVTIYDSQGAYLNMSRFALEIYGFETIEEARKYRAGRRFLRDKPFDLYRADGKLLLPDDYPIIRVLQGRYLRDIRLKVRCRATQSEIAVALSGIPVRDRQGKPAFAIEVVCCQS